MSQNESFEFLENVKLNDVKKVWKKAITGATKDTSNSSSCTTSSDKSKNIDKQSTKGDSDNIMNEIKQSKGDKGILKFYTVGDGSVQTLAKNYTLQAAALAAAQQKDSEEEQDEEEMKKYVSCFLDVPADRSGGKPHQGEKIFNYKE